MNRHSPTGRVIRDADGLELIVERSVDAPAREVWDWLTLPEHLQQWIGTWEGTPRVGGVISFTMTAESEAEPEPVTILVCEPANHFLADMGTQGWRVGFSLAEVGATTIIFFTQRLDNAADASSIGPGWEYYLDRMIAARGGQPLPIWDDYYPAFAPYYKRVALSPS